MDFVFYYFSQEPVPLDVRGQEEIALHGLGSMNQRGAKGAPDRGRERLEPHMSHS